jgi:hypothetical protein
MAHDERRKASERRTKERRIGVERRDEAAWQLVSMDDT